MERHKAKRYPNNLKKNPHQTPFPSMYFFTCLILRTLSKAKKKQHHHSINTLLAQQSSFVATQGKSAAADYPLRKLASNKFKLRSSADSPQQHSALIGERATPPAHN